MNPIEIGGRREVCWDEALIDSTAGISLKMHKPVRRNIAFDCTETWEGNHCDYFTVMNDDGFFRLYYHTAQARLDLNCKSIPSHPAYVCYAESKDGIHFERVPLRRASYWGNPDTNILLEKYVWQLASNFVPFKDTNPNCPTEEQYKALVGCRQLYCYRGPNGTDFENTGILVDDGQYDTQNVCFWDDRTKLYYLYYRGAHGYGTVNGQWTEEEENAAHMQGIRDVRVRTSPDFVNWSEPKLLDFGPEAEDIGLYVNQVAPYYRAPHMMLGFPVRYNDRFEDKNNFRYLPDREQRYKWIRGYGRGGTVQTDTVLMTSRDGLHFDRTDEAFIDPGPECGTNWYYGNSYTAYGITETASDIPGEPNEISVYVVEGTNTMSTKLRRYTVRLDGFFSWHCGHKPGKLITKPLSFEGEQLSINFSTSAAGFLRIRLLDEEGKYIEGFDSGNLFGNSVDRPVDFDHGSNLANLNGKTVRIELTMSEAELYAFQFRPGDPI